MSPAIFSVGIDIGTSTTQVIFSKLLMDNTAGYFSAPRISIVGKEIVYKSPVYDTPLQSQFMLDGEGIREIVEREYRAAGRRPEDLDTGAVIITGESARKENAALVSQQLSGLAGEFVVSTAGPDLESILAGKGSGAFQYSLDMDCIVANLDIGGGTTNIVIFDHGEVAGKGCLNIGGRLIRLERDYTVTYISPAAQTVAEAVGVRLTVGRRTSEEELSRVTGKMAELLAQSLGLLPREELLRRVQTPSSTWLVTPGRIDRICFSGGVSDCMAKEGVRLPLEFGDIGVLLGRSIKNHPLFSGNRVIIGTETIGATVVGAGTYTTNISGSTIEYSQSIFPIKNAPVLKLNEAEQRACLTGEVQTLREKCGWFLGQCDSPLMILAMKGSRDPSYDEIKTMAGCIVEALDGLLSPEQPIIVLLENDIAKALGMAMKAAAGDRRKVAAIDGVKVEENDYVDIGRPLMDGLVVPVIVKTLIFG